MERLQRSAEPIVEIFPVPRGAPPRVVGPGRREREYLTRVAGLQSALEAAALVERGSSRRLDRMERKLDAVREVVDLQQKKEHRLILALGALQRENEMLREKLALGSGERRPKALPAPKRSFLARLFHRA
ncbi:MAG: hypothetical protein ACKVXR_07200 [Planctomycetota bacterium]